MPARWPSWPLLAAALVAGALAVPAAAAAPAASQQSDPDEAVAGIDLAGAGLAQDGKLKLTVSAHRPIDTGGLKPGRGYLCLELSRGAGKPVARSICVRRGSKSGRLSLSLTRGGKKTTLAGEVRRAGDRKIKATFLPQDVGLEPARWSWSVVSAADRAACPPAGVGAGCGDRVPDRTPGELRVRRARVVGCERRGRSFVFHGPSSRRRIALTFDDGPSSYTPQILRLLERHRAHATFFELGEVMGGRQATMRRVLEQGSEIGNHSMNHGVLSGGGSHAASQLAATNARIKAATGFRPCVFRAPYGAVGAGLLAAARHAGMTTVQWSIDTNDWQTPGAGAIYARAVGPAGSGSIVLMHDGGGARGGTVAALGPILSRLTKRGYEMVTVSELLGYEAVWGEWGRASGAG